MQNWRQTIYNIIQKDEGNSRASKAYDIVMMFMIMISLAPLTFTSPHPETRVIELVTVSFFILDYFLRWITADYKLGRGRVSFLIYPFTFMAIIDQLSIVPVFSLLNKSFKLFRITRLFRVVPPAEVPSLYGEEVRSRPSLNPSLMRSTGQHLH